MGLREAPHQQDTHDPCSALLCPRKHQPRPTQWGPESQCMGWICPAAALSQGALPSLAPLTWPYACQAAFAQLEGLTGEGTAVPSRDRHLSTASQPPNISTQGSGLQHRPVAGLLCHMWWHLVSSHREGVDWDIRVSEGSWCPGAAAEGTAGITPRWGRVSPAAPHAPPKHALCHSPPLSAVPALPLLHHHLSRKGHGSASRC